MPLAVVAEYPAARGLAGMSHVDSSPRMVRLQATDGSDLISMRCVFHPPGVINQRLREDKASIWQP
jgi:hypothetical protein